MKTLIRMPENLIAACRRPPVMNGIIEFRNPLSGRYAVRTESGRYTTFRLLAGGVVLETGEDVSGALEGPALQTLRSARHGYMNVFVESARLARSAAQSWVLERARDRDSAQGA